MPMPKASTGSREGEWPGLAMTDIPSVSGARLTARR
jgi:hypothetical protein